MAMDLADLTIDAIEGNVSERLLSVFVADYCEGGGITLEEL